MEEEKKEEPKKVVGPTIEEFKGKPILRLPLVDDPSPDVTWHWFTFGRSKAKAIVKYFDEIKKFSENQ